MTDVVELSEERTDDGRSAATYVVGIDGSEESQRALDWVQLFARRTDHIRAVRVWDLPPVLTDSIADVLPYDFELEARHALLAAIGERGDDRVEPVVRRHRAAAHGLLAEVGEVTASAVVVGHRGESRLSMFLGSVARQVAEHAPVPVVVVRGDVRPTRRVLVGIDGGGDPDAVTRAARLLRWAFGLADVEEVVAAQGWSVPTLTVATRWQDDHIGSLETAARESLQSVLDAAGEPPDGVRVTSLVERGDPSRMLVEHSGTADLVVVGSRGRGGFAGLLLGSTSAHVAAHSAVPVAVVR